MNWEELNFLHSDTIQIRFNDIDGLGHVNNATQNEYFDLGRMHYFEHILENPINWKEFAMVIASVHTNFEAPILLHENIEVNSKVYKLGDKSLKMAQVITNAKTGEIKSTCKSVMVAIDFSTGKSIELSEKMRTAVENFERK